MSGHRKAAKFTNFFSELIYHVFYQSGPCYPCTQKTSLSCSCTRTVQEVPCGVERSPPVCFYTCQRLPQCDHTELAEHQCHFDQCPPCALICDQPLPNCQHRCPHVCHVAVTKMTHTMKPIHPLQNRPNAWGQIPKTNSSGAVRLEVVSEVCPPCPHPVNVTCYGLHEVHFFRRIVKPKFCNYM